MTRAFLALALVASLAACSSTNIAQTEVALTTAERLALVYVTQPACTGTNGPLCSDAATIAKIKAADVLAYSAVKQAQAGTIDVSQATAEVSALAALIPTATK